LKMFNTFPEAQRCLFSF